LNNKALADNTKAVEDYYKSLGYILAKVADVSMQPTGILAVKISEGIVEDIVIKGNVKTKPFVVTREMKLKKGQPFNSKDARKSLQKIYDLGYFQDVNMKLIPGTQPGAIVVSLEVVEEKTGVFSIGGGYSASNGMVAIVEVGDTNFLGNGDSTKVHLEFGGNVGANGNNYGISFTRPWIDSKHTSVSLNIYSMAYQYTDSYQSGDEKSSFVERFQGFEISFSRPESDYVTNFMLFKNRLDTFVLRIGTGAI